MCRLAQLLRHFELPPTASAAELRREYLRRVKLVHPDVGSGSPDDFLKLRRRFDEASELLSARPPGGGVGVAGAAHGAAWSQGGGQQGRWAGSAWSAAGDCHGPWAHAAGAARAAAAAQQQAAQVPVVGLPGAVVYPAASLFVAAALPLAFVLAPDRPPASPRRAPSPRRASSSPQAERGAASRLALEAGPWSVEACRAVDASVSTAESVKGRARAGIKALRYTGDGQLSPARRYRPVVEDGVSMPPVHVAARDGRVWWLERCGATADCRELLHGRDARGETPLHHAARSGKAPACAALLRLGADPAASNDAGQLPADLAEAIAHPEIASLLQGGQEDPGGARRHPDGLGVLAEPPSGVTFVGLREAESLRLAVNMAAGSGVAPPVPISRAVQEADGTGERAVNVIRGSLQSTEFDLEDVSAEAVSAADPWAAATAPAAGVGGVAEVCGLLLYEPAGSASPDAPGHWAALRRRPPPPAGAGDAGGEQEFWRLDPVRGPFRVSEQELGQLLQRYRAWRVVRGPEGLRAARMAELSRARREAAALAQSHTGPPLPAAPA